MSNAKAASPAENKRNDSDVVRMLRVGEDDMQAFEELVDRYQSRVLGILIRVIGSREEAEDLAQEVFLRVFRSRKKYQPTAKFATWLFTIVNNLALNAIRDRGRRPSHSIAGSESGPLGPRPLEQMVGVSTSSLPSRVFAKGEMAEIVRAAVTQLSEEQRMAVMLNKFEGMNYREIADVMGKSEMAIKSLLSRARGALKEILKPYLSTGQRPTGM